MPVGISGQLGKRHATLERLWLLLDFAEKHRKQQAGPADNCLQHARALPSHSRALQAARRFTAHIESVLAEQAL